MNGLNQIAAFQIHTSPGQSLAVAINNNSKSLIVQPPMPFVVHAFWRSS